MNNYYFNLKINGGFSFERLSTRKAGPVIGGYVPSELS